ncbi:hypothetical protein [Pelagicoccus sp. SDUM812002]|uniref:hypothetical protein n=1 Tax=Pelagicoccus sp. SDUM812002 TaxID=3041266 RepID=UPI002810915C|nr:hypothetical protein [Pelagicoccus sp. SDUM812002]MDQ8187641.1 hypothetical protein [Pelagicoccus sp. SDUM812002]
MKTEIKTLLTSLFASAFIFALAGCSDNDVGDDLEDAADEAKDATEELADEAKEAGEDIADGVKDATN